MNINPLHILLTGFLIIFGISNSFGQNCNPIDTNLIIPDNQITTVQITIDNILNNDLSNPGQCLLGVQLEFEHDHIGDLTISLTSPNGDEIQLMGPHVVNFPTPFAHWDVFFTSCGSPTAPDPPNFPSTWDNEASWAAFGNYNGIYHPYDGCMESFDEGPVNGTWTLTIQDHIEYDEGELFGINFFFCDPTGMDCSLCEADAGMFEIPELSYCEGDPQLELDTPQIIFDPVPDPLKYAYQFFSVFSDTIHQVQDVLDLTEEAAGNYLICGISYNRNDSIFLDSIKPGVSFANVNELINADNSNFCANITDTCLQIEILPVGEILDTLIFLCPGDTLLYDNSFYTQKGDYYIVDDSEEVCGKITRLRIDDYGLDASIEADSYELDCDLNTIELRAISSSIQSDVTFFWETDNGNFISDIDQTEVVISRPGIYYFILEKNNCFDTTAVTIFSDGSLPDFALSGGTIDCNNPYIQIELTPFGPYSSISWTDPENNILNDEDPVVSLAGNYLLELTGNNGCTSIGTTFIGIDTIYPIATLLTDTLNCVDTSVVIQFESPDSLNYIYWPQLDLLTEDPVVLIPGLYEVQYSGPNGCISTNSIEVFGDFNFPEITITTDTLTCEQPEVLLDVSYTDDTLSFEWTDPENETFMSEDILTGIPGWHDLTVINEFNCKLDTSLLIIEDVSAPSFFMPDSIVLACDEDSVKLAVFYIDPFKDVLWTGPGGYSVNAPEPYVKKLGLYHVEVTGFNGCKSLDSIRIVNPPEVPEVTIEIDTINCQNPTGKIQLLYSGDLSFFWTDEMANNYTGPVINSDLGGYYNLTITDNDYNCTSETVIELPVDTIPSNININTPDTLNCLNPMVELSLGSTNDWQSVHWTGNGIDEYGNPIIVNSIGWYYAEVLGDNYCTSIDSVFITEQEGFLEEPDIFYLDCALDSLEVSIEMIPNATYRWSLNGQFISNEISIFIQEAGNYDVVVNTDSGCIDSTSVEVIDDRILPVFDLLSIGELNCIDSSLLLTADLISDIIDFEWNGPGLTSNLLSNTIYQEGTYYFTAEGANHCRSTDSIIISANRNFPEIEAIGDSVNCFDNDNALYISANITDDYNNLYWIGPNFYVSGDLTNNVQDTGAYILTVEGDKGCFSMDTTYVLIDTLPVSFTIDPIDTINCFRDSTLLAISTNDDFTALNWTGPNDFDASGNSVYASIPGMYWVSLQGENGCINKKLFEIPQNKLIPYMQISANEISCKQPKVPVILETNIVQMFVQWTGPDNFTYTGQNPVVLKTGTYHATITDLNNGCQNEDSIIIQANLEPPVIESEVYYLGCDGDSIQIGITTDPNDVSVIWNGPDNFYSIQDKPWISESGIYYVQVKRNDNGCSSGDSVVVSEDPQLPSFNIYQQDLNCQLDSVRVFLTDEFLVDSLFWLGPNGYNSTEDEAVIFEPGTYNLLVKATNGCLLDTSFVISKDTLAPDIIIKYDDFLLCEKNTARLNAMESSSGSNFIYEWESSSGMILSGSHTLNPLVEGPAVYTLIITDLQNGCQAIDSIEIEQKESEMDSLLLLLKRPSCFGFEDGKITVNAVLTGYEPYKYSLNGSNYTISNIFTNKPADNYTLSVKDAYGCVLDTSFILPHGPEIQLVLTASEQEIHIGESVVLEALVMSENEISVIEWEPLEHIVNPFSFTNEVTPFESTVFFLYLEDEFGCNTSDHVTILVKEAPEVFIPNIFTPNGDDINDKFFVLGKSGVENIETFEIFDRWGNRVFAAYDIQPGDYNSGWDGTYRGQPLNPGIYVYHLAIMSKNGKLIHLAGDITLIR